MDIGAWLRELGLERYEQAFRADDINAEILAELTEADLERLGVSSLGHRKKLLKAIAGLGRAVAVAAARRSRPASAEAPVAPSDVGSEAERRQLTVMFVDLVGSTELATRLDPEDLRVVMRAYQSACAGVINRYEGYVAKFMGDGVLAYFGWPRAHEDDAERAVRAGLELTERVAGLEPGAGLDLKARVGVATGLVVVGGLLGEGAAQEEAVVGETPNLAARLQGVAEPGAVVIAPATRRLLGALFELRDLGRHDLKGFAEPVPAWQVIGGIPVDSRFQALRRGHRTPLVGRGRELDALEAARGEAANGHGQVVAAVGEAGVGKSRLFDEFLRSDTFGAWRLRRCGCLPYGANTPWLPVVNLVKGYFGIQDRDDQERATEKISEGLAPFGAAVAWAATPVRALLDLTIDDAAWQALNPPQRRRRILDAVKGLLLLETDRQPLMLIVEDLHWADEETVALLDSLVESLPSQRMLILATYRPEFEHRWGGRACYCQLRIDPLGTEDAGRLLRALLGSDPSVADLERSLVDRTGGNPLFLEEAVRDLAETGVLDGQPGAYRLTGELGSLRLPQTVQAILAARIDRLSEEARQLLQRAAVIGHEVPRVLLEAVVDLQGEALDRRLGELQAAEMLHETRPMPEVEYTFKHALTHDVAYGTMLRESRRTLHRRVGEAMEALYSERLIELAETLADHFERGEVWAKAARYALDAAEKAKSRYAYKVGMRIADQARAAAKDPALIQEWIWANVQRGDLASLLDDLELANESYAQALSKSKDLSERRWIENKHHALRFAIRDGAKIAYYVHGSGHQTLVFVIPIAYGLAVFQPIIERLCQEFRIITINPRGTIGSDPLPQAYTLVDHALDVATVVGTAAEHPVTAIGISLGTTILTHAVSAAPQLFEKLVMVGAVAGMPVPNSARARCAAAEMQAIAKADFEGALRGLSASIISEPGTDDLQQLWSETRLRLPKETILNFYQQVTPDQMAAVPLLQKLRKPTLVMHGTADIRIPVEEGRQIAERVEGAQFYPLEGRCHLCMFTATDEFCDVLRDFVRTGRVSVPVVHAVGVLDK